MTSADNIRDQVVAHTTAMHDMAARVLDNHGEPSYTPEKLSCVFRADVCAVALLGWSARELRRRDGAGVETVTAGGGCPRQILRRPAAHAESACGNRAPGAAAGRRMWAPGNRHPRRRRTPLL